VPSHIELATTLSRQGRGPFLVARRAHPVTRIRRVFTTPLISSIEVAIEGRCEREALSGKRCAVPVLIGWTECSRVVSAATMKWPAWACRWRSSHMLYFGGSLVTH